MGFYLPSHLRGSLGLSKIGLLENGVVLTVSQKGKKGTSTELVICSVKLTLLNRIKN